MEVISAREVTPGGAQGAGGSRKKQYILRTARGEYLYTAPDNATLSTYSPGSAVPRAYNKFYDWLARPVGPAPNAQIIWNRKGQPMVDLDAGEARSEVQPLAADAAATAALPPDYDREWKVDALRPGAPPLCPACGKPARKKSK